VDDALQAGRLFKQPDNQRGFKQWDGKRGESRGDVPVLQCAIGTNKEQATKDLRPNVFEVLVLCESQFLFNLGEIWSFLSVGSWG
jgi:hypothetical protein